MTLIQPPPITIPLPPGRTERWARLLVNPSSGEQGAVAQLPTIVNALESVGMQAVVSFTSQEHSPTELAAQAVRERYDLVVAVGGDGTVSAIAQGLLGTDIPLGIVPVGTYNNIARSLSIPANLDDAVEVLLHGQPWRIDSATVNGTPFMEVAGVGLDARLFPVAEEIKLGSWSALPKAVQTLRAYRPRKLWIEFADGSRVATRPLLAMVSNMPYFGVGFAIAPTARPDSGQLVLSLFENMTKLQLLGYFAAVANGGQVEEPRIVTYQGSSFRIAAASRPAMPVQADGQVVGETPVVFAVLPHALTVVAPPQHRS
jgi:diacylglycerol kinase (ATP)